MPPRVSDRINALRKQRAAALAPETETQPEAQPEAADASLEAAEPVSADVSSIRAHFGGPLGQLTDSRPVQRLPLAHIAPDLRPDMQQPRMLPRPEELLHEGKPVPAYQELVTELLALGHSLKERQIQPIVVYPGTSEEFPTARYLILVGHRRWVSACLVGMETIDAIIVEPPTPAERVRIQYTENEDREEFSDMERAWSLLQMKQSLGDVPWEEVETRLQMSRTRRHQLIRLLAFTPEQQQQVALLRLQETQIRSLHTAVRASELQPPQVDMLLTRLADIAAERLNRAAQEDQAGGEASGSAARRSGIDGPTVARLVARARRAATPAEDVSPTPRWLTPLREQITRTSQRLKQSLERVEQLNDQDSDALQTDLRQLQTHIEQLLDRMSDKP
jgi:ParB/RepB/Spo0J family partition protein